MAYNDRILLTSADKNCSHLMLDDATTFHRLQNSSYTWN